MQTSLLEAIAGELDPESGSARCLSSPSGRARLCLLPQQPWIYSGTIRNNILFGAEYDKALFDKVKVFFFISHLFINIPK